MKVATAIQMQNLDRRAINDFGIPGIVLMENAGQGTVRAIYQYFPEVVSKKVIIFTGRGNNGGDGFVIGRHLINRGVEVVIFLLTEKGRVTGDAQINMELYQKLKPIHELHHPEDLIQFKDEIGQGSLIIDAILGTGLKSEVTGFYREVINYINSLSIPVVAVDIPSGIDASTGRVLGVAIHAKLTVTFGLPKLGLVIHPGLDLVGSMEVVDISIPDYLVREENIQVELLESSDIIQLLKHRLANTHKGHYGHLLIVAGSAGKTGAAAMTSEAALRIGAGLITLGIPSSLNPIMENKLTEVMTEPLPETSSQTLSIKSWGKVKELMEGKKAIAVGPGISTHPETIEVVSHIVRNSSVPLIIDADGINALSEKQDLLKEATSPLVLTPHIGEMARLLQSSVQRIQEDRVGVAKKFAQENGVCLVLKGARTIIAEPQGSVYINPTGNPGLASGGTGDVLTGMIAGLVAQGYSVSEASRLGVYLHGYIADSLTRKIAEMGMTATDLLAKIPLTLKEVMSSNGISN
ncbi:MAG: NAD(P)H-hydrate dehydratase [Deltaproteobacteria bacterium]|nr:NAD(P)H-hydrate dehydratase [Deltaproteobacteria bacterium]